MQLVFGRLAQRDQTLSECFQMMMAAARRSSNQMLRKISLVLALAAQLARAAAPAEWKCGTAGTEEAAYDLVRQRCPTSLSGSNACCT